MAATKPTDGGFTVPSVLPSSLSKLSALLNASPHVFALPQGDEEVSKTALEVAKGLFDLGLELEKSSHPALRPLVQQIAEADAATTTRSASLKAQPSSKKEVDASKILPYTPSAGLFIDGMTDDQVWKQLEMRAEGLGNVFKVIGVESGEQDDEDALPAHGDEDDSEEDEEDEDDDDDMSEGEQELLEEMMDQNLSVEEMEEMLSEYRQEKRRRGGEDGEESEEDEDEDEDEEMDEMSEEDELEEDDIEEDELDEEDVDMDDENHEEEEEDEEESDMIDPLFAGRSKQAHPTLDDEFFSIDAFNRITEEAEAGKMSSGRLGAADDEDDEEDGEDDLMGLLNGTMGDNDEEDADPMYSDFFAPPPKGRSEARRANAAKASSSAKSKGKGKEKADTKAAANGRDDEDEGTGGMAEYGRNAMNRVRADLFADDDEDDPEAALSSHEKRQLALREQIKALEQENVGPKDWTLLGEATARARPENSLLEEDLEFEHVGKVVPVITEERVASLEEIIKRRILDNNFDDVVRRREMDDKAFLPSRFFELQDTQSSRSLAQIYEDEFTAASTAAAGGKVVDPRDAKLQKEHEEIDRLWGEISYTLDALSNLNYTPKQPKTAITTISNVASTTLESALPTTQSTSTMLAPEEMFAPPSASSLVARSELDPEQKRKARQKARKEKMHLRQGLDAAVDKFAGKGGGGGKARGGVKAQKDKALQELVKTGKGVTVIGKDSTKKRGGKAPEASAVQASKLKL